MKTLAKKEVYVVPMNPLHSTSGVIQPVFQSSVYSTNKNEHGSSFAPMENNLKLENQFLNVGNGVSEGGVVLLEGNVE